MEKKAIFTISNEREEKLWNEAIIIFDSSSLLDIYFLPKQTRDKVFKNHFNAKLKNRLWIPSHVYFEYNKNRENIVKKPITETYDPIAKDIATLLKKNISTIKSNISDLQNKTKKDDKHPHLKQEAFEKYLEVIKVFEDESSYFEKTISEEISTIKKEINSLTNNDDVLKAIEKYFAIGREFTFNEIIEITKEGEHRYNYSIPPGYKDKNDKIGFQIFGDLIIWKQIIEHAKEIKKPILFICNDLKEDWCYLDESNREKRIKSPREELVREIFDEAEVDFWMYNFSQFLYKSNEFLFDSDEEIITSDNILSFSQILDQKKEVIKKHNKHRVIYQNYYPCNECDGDNEGFGNFISYWIESPLINEYPSLHRNSKFNTGYIGSCDWCSTLHLECPKCYTINSINSYNNNEKISCEGGCGLIFYIESDLHYDCNGDYDIKIIDHRVEECSACGEDYIKDDNNTGICKECNEKYGTE